MNSTDTVRCVIDRDVLNKHTFHDFQDIGLWLLATLCGKNRGTFVLDPPDGKTYGCVEFPEHFAELAGVKYDNITDSNSIALQYAAKNITAADAVDLVDLYVQSVYRSTPWVDRDPMACAVNGLTKLECGDTSAGNETTIRAVTLVGVFVPAPWATGGKALTLDEAKEYYTAEDFADMAKLGLNAVQIPVPLGLFEAEDSSGELELLGDLLNMAADANLNAVVALQEDVDSTIKRRTKKNMVQAATWFVMSYNNVIALVVPSADLITVARLESASLLLMVPTNFAELPFFTANDPNVYVALDKDHTTSIGDIASSESVEDRNKLYFHEMMACQLSAPSEYAACYRSAPAYVHSGFNLAIDNCISKDSDDFIDYGQCGRFDETIDSPWWEAHRTSYAARQLAAFESGAGWAFDAWKLYNEVPSSVDVIDTPAKLMTLKNVAAAGLMPSLLDSSPAQLACLNPPLADAEMGDDTFAPTAAPVDCGDGWWVEEKGKCEYWIPPTPAPAICPRKQKRRDMLLGGGIGVVVAVVVGGIIVVIINRKRRAGYTQVTEANV